MQPDLPLIVEHFATRQSEATPARKIGANREARAIDKATGPRQILGVRSESGHRLARSAAIVATLVASVPARAQVAEVADAGAVRTLTLAEAVESATRLQPAVRQAAAASAAAAGRVEQARSFYLPQVTLTAQYLRTTGNFAPRPGALPGNITTSQVSSATFDSFNFGVAASQLIYDFGQTCARWNAAIAGLDSFRAQERAAQNLVVLNVRATYFLVRAEKGLAKVALETLANQQKHLAQVEGFVTVGTRPGIDLATARTQVANARVSLIATENVYGVAKVQLNQAMGVAGSTRYDVTDEGLGPVEGEGQAGDALVARALSARPEMESFAWQRRAQDLSVSALKSAYFPTLSATGSATETGVALGSLVPNVAIGAVATWPILQGGLTRGLVHESEANLRVIEAQADAERLQIGVEVEQARLAVRANKATVEASNEALINAQDQLRLAEARYGSGLGNIVELSDAQVAVSLAGAQQVQALFNLSTSRAQLLYAMGRR